MRASAMLLTVGHSTHTMERFLELLAGANVRQIIDVRSSPFSKLNPQFNRPVLLHRLHAASIRYTFLGQELGARTDDASCYWDGRVHYDKIAETAQFQHGIDRVLSILASGEQTALMCAEKEPLDCHRTILVARHLVKRGVDVRHLLADGSVVSHEQLMAGLMGEFQSRQYDLFATAEQLLDEAYRGQEEKIAYRPAAEDGAAEIRGVA